MSWSIACVENTLEVPEACGEELVNLVETFDGEEHPVDLDLWSYYPKLEFNDDHMEHMDAALYRDDVREILAKHKVNGRVCFGSLEGDNAGRFWGFEWTNGELRDLKGSLQWAVVDGE